MSVFRGDASEVFALANSLAGVGAKSVPAARAGMALAGEAVAKSWRNAVLSASDGDSTIPHYPDAIDSELVFDIRGVSVDIGPNKAKKQGSLGHLIEFGTETSPPHLHGLAAVTSNEALAERVLDQAIHPLFP